MSFLDDPEMKEVVEGFCTESLDLLNILEDTLNKCEDSDYTDNKPLEEFGQIIDRIMGAAKSMGADEVGSYCELGKIIGYKSSQVETPALIEVVVAVLFDTVDLLRKMVNQIQSGNSALTEGINLKAFGTRLHWLSDKFKDIERASCAITEGADADNGGMNQGNIDDLLSDLGL